MQAGYMASRRTQDCGKAQPTTASDNNTSFQFIDLFCGCGGFTLGMIRAGLKCLAAIDFNKEAIATLKNNLPDLTHVLERDLTRYSPGQLADLIGREYVDIIVGGPPCQGFSTARQVDGSNHGENLINDPRRYLYRKFLQYVDFFQPKLFVIENVLGLRSAAGGEYFTRVQNEARGLGRAQGRPGYRVHAQIENAWELGVPQKRRRQLIIGVRNDLPGYFPSALMPACRAKPKTNLGDAIGDLPELSAGQGEDERDYDLALRKQHINTTRQARNYLYRVLEIARARKLTNHVSRPHSERDLRDFSRLREGENSATAIRERGVTFEFPYDKSSFKDRYTRQNRIKPCSTIVAHLGKDGLMFIHPTQNRSLTPREAARVQSFPDWFRFPKARTHAFRLIGNAVPPLVAEAVGLAIKEFLGLGSGMHAQLHFTMPKSLACRNIQTYFTSNHAAAIELEKLAQLDRHSLRALPAADILRGWQALLFIFPDLHPDNARDHGKEVEQTNSRRHFMEALEKMTARRYARSGWPVALELIGVEVWRRHKNGQISRDELYCVEAKRALLSGSMEQ